METKANHVFVGAVTLALLAALAAFVIWLGRMNEGAQNQYDIFFAQSVGGLAKGGSVSFSGVPVGTIDKIELWPKDPSFVRVRISLDKKVPVLVGTTATILGSFTGVSAIQLEGAVKGADPITEPGPEGVPVIPTKRGGLGELINNAPLLLDRLTVLSERMNQLLSDENQATFRGILVNTNRLTGELAGASPQVKPIMADLQGTLRQATLTLAKFEGVAGRADSMLSTDGETVVNDLRKTLRSVKVAADELQATLSDARPAAAALSSTTLPAADAALRDLRAATKSLRAVTDKLDEQGAGALLGGQKLPEYAP